MKEPWQSYLQLGVVHGMAFPECLAGEGPQLETLEQICHDPYFEAVDVGPIVDPVKRGECAALLRDCQMTVTLSCQPVLLRQQLDLNSPDAGERRKAIQTIIDLLDQGKELGASRIALLSGKNPPADERSGATQRLIDSLKQLSKAARERVGIPIMMEIFDYDMDKKALVGPCATAATVARAVRLDYPEFGLLHDLSHIYLCHEEPAKHFPLIREHLVAVHMGSSVSDRKHPLFGDTHPLFGMPGGDNNVPQVRDFIRTLFDIGFLRPGRRPVCGFEIKPPAGTRSATAIANMKRTWEKAWWSL